MPANTHPTLVDLLRHQADRRGDKLAFTFTVDGQSEQDRLTYRELDAKARAIAAGLQRAGATGRRVLVICRPGLDSVAAYFGCLYAGAVAVPVQDRLVRLMAIVPDARAGHVLADAETQTRVKAAVDGMVRRPLQWSLPEAPLEDAESWTAPDIHAGTTAMMQYTSGSTRAPKGVVLTHANLLANLAAIHEAWGGTENDVAVYWLPQHHDMGLIGGILETVYVGCSTVLLSPAGFITRPIRWLEVISRYRGTMTAAPNFAYNLCVERSTPDERAALDLSSLATAMNGAEPVHAETLRTFAEAFAPSGLRPQALMPVYGLAEASLLVSGGSEHDTPLIRWVDRGELGADRIVDADPEAATTVSLVSCGRPRGGQRIVIVDPETRRQRGAEEVGEIWVAGPSVAAGYRGKPEDTEKTFGAYLADTREGPFLRTGDLGFLHDDELFITGRCKDLIILAGNHYYPNDIESTVQACHPVLLAGRGAAFSITSEAGTSEQLVVVQEVARQRIQESDLPHLVGAAGAALGKHHGVVPHRFVLVDQMTIPTTSSGKIQRSRCREMFLDGELAALFDWTAPAPDGTVMDPDSAAKRAALIQQAVANHQLKTQRR
ncbi:fatty acyl-AMP ligase [[Mycobacterium] nativiensis]|uniref:Fatty acyl-AMP ligase n=1 Tax=[Mycobacterium] nativiensis TaxID=2855503 RepID=A0ABU5Y1I0_9MYCO|nr:fatty acyl-AMP ligase [Mycolicibacter sp. MYC340]MEB3034097.1 fatty acyl-AMP ligase [Mycolicibacter sp. MYC340]